ncbi:MAG: hypothetical protein NVS3B11_23840 [Collimonas sp.]
MQLCCNYIASNTGSRLHLQLAAFDFRQPHKSHKSHKSHKPGQNRMYPQTTPVQLSQRLARETGTSADLRENVVARNPSFSCG